MKITQEILDSGKWLSEEIFKFKGRKYKKAICTYCGEEFLSLWYNKGTYCSKNCAMRNREVSDETRQLLSNKKKGKKRGPMPEAQKEKISVSNKGRIPWNIGIPCPEEQKQRASETLKGNIPWNKGKKGSQVPWNKGKKGVQVGPNKGKKLGPQTEETKRKRAEALTCPYTSKLIPKYDLYAPQLEPYEECKRGKHDPNILRVRCAYCGKWIFPTLYQVRNRIMGIKNNDTHRFYCSTECKKECPIYGQMKYFKGQRGTYSREVQPELRQLVFIRDDYTCQKCDTKGGSLHCHHITGVEQNPIESADVDNCITLCKICHKFVHTQKGCRYYDLRRCKEENKTMVTL